MNSRIFAKAKQKNFRNRTPALGRKRPGWSFTSRSGKTSDAFSKFYFGHKFEDVHVNSPPPKQSCPLSQCSQTQRQGKMTVSLPDDEYEKEADRLAKKVLQIPDKNSPSEQKRLKDEREDVYSAKPMTTQNMTRELQSQISSMGGYGKPLPDSLKSYFETRLGYDLAGVRIHSDARSSYLAKRLGVSAFTTADHIFFRDKEPLTNSFASKQLLAHELVHVLQQAKGNERKAVQFKPKDIRTPKVPNPVKGSLESTRPAYEVLPKEKELDQETAAWAEIQIGLERDIYQVMDSQTKAAYLGAKKAIDRIFTGIDELAELDTLYWQSVFAPIRMMPVPFVGGYIGKQIDTIINIEVGMEKKAVVKRLRKRLVESIEERIIGLTNVNSKAYRKIELNLLVDTKDQWVTLMDRYKWGPGDARYKILLRQFLFAKYGLEDATTGCEKWETWFVDLYGNSFYKLFKKSGLIPEGE
jgi:hypothetical protein